MAAVEAESPSVEAMSQVLSYLVMERQTLRSHGASKSEVEANRRAIVAMQWRLNRALGSQHARLAS